MRSHVLLGFVGGASLLLAIAACSSTNEDTPTDTTADSGGGKPSSSGSSGGEEEEEKDAGTTTKKDAGKDSGPSTPPLPSVTLSQGDQQLLAIVGDDAVYFEFGGATTALFAVPINGSGQPTKIADLGNDDDMQISGGAVAVWTNINNAGLGTLNVWTRATGLETNIATNSGAGAFFAASEDGSRIAFSQDLVVSNNNVTSVPIGIRDTSAATNAVTLTDTTASGNAFNIAAANCQPNMAFSGRVFFAEFCTGTDTAASVAKLITVAADGTAVVRLDAAGAGDPPTLKPSASFTADDAGTKVFALRDTDSAGRIFTVGGTVGGVAVENNIDNGVMLADGSAVVYRTTGNVMKKATTVASPVITTLVAADAKGFLGISPDNKHVLFRKLDPANGDPPVDVNTVDHTAASPAPVALIPTLAAFPLGVNGASSHLVYADNVGQNGGTLKSMPLAGGASKTLGNTIGVHLARSGTSAVSVTDPQPANGGAEFEVTTITLVDTVSGTTKPIAIEVPDGEVQIKNKRLVYSRFGATGSGIYAADLP